MDKIRNTLTYRFSIFAGLYTVVTAILFNYMSTTSALVFFTVILIPVLFVMGVSFLIMDLVKPFRFSKSLTPNGFIAAAEIVLILVYVFVSSFIVIGILWLPEPNIENIKENLLIAAVYTLIGLLSALAIRIMLSKKQH